MVTCPSTYSTSVTAANPLATGGAASSAAGISAGLAGRSALLPSMVPTPRHCGVSGLN